jgi:hypothetical protein
MKKLIALALLLACPAVRASVLFYDALNYPNGLIETDGVWQVYAPLPPNPPYTNTFVSNNLIVLNGTKSSQDAVEVPFTNSSSSIVYASFTIKASAALGSYFAEFQNTNDTADVAHVFASTTGTVVPGTYRLGIANYATSASSAKFFPMDLATNTTYNVVIAWDPVQTDPFPGATLVVNPASAADFASSPSFGTDNSPSTAQKALTNVTAFALSSYVTAGIGRVAIGTSFGDVFSNAPTAATVAVAPTGTNVYSGNSVTLYSAGSGLGELTYQWFSNTVALIDDGANVIGSTSNVLLLNNLQNTATYTVAISNSAGGSVSAPAVISVVTTPTVPFFVTAPKGATNTLGSTITLSASANGTGPITYEWYFQATNATSYSLVGTAPTLSLSGVTYAQSGSYYVTATGGAGATNSNPVLVNVVAPPSVTIGYLHGLLRSNNVVSGTLNLNGGSSFQVQGLVTSIGSVESSTYSEYFVQDSTGGALVFVNGTGATNVPAVGSLVQIVGPAQQYYGQLELVPNPLVAGTITVLSTNNPLPPTIPLNLAQEATNTMGPAGLNAQGALSTITNVYLYTTKTGTPVTGKTFPTNGSQALYAFAAPYSTNQPYLEVYVTTYTNANNQLNTNFFGQPIPSFVYELTGAIDVYATNQPELIPSRYVDFVTNQPAPFQVSLTQSNGVSTLKWPATVGDTYSVYTSTNVTGPWTQTFGLGYYPSVGSFTVTNTASALFFKMTSP